MKQNQDVLNEGTQRTTGKSARDSNIQAALAVGDIIKSTLGPMGMDKMLIDSVGNVVITNDGVKILKEMEIEHPGAKLMLEVAKTQELEVGDGTTSAVLLCSSLLKESKELLQQSIHPNVIVSTYQRVLPYLQEMLLTHSKEISLEDKKVFSSVIQTAMVGKISENSREFLSELLLEILAFLQQEESSFSLKSLKIAKATGASIKDSQLISGIVLDKLAAHPNMPKKIQNAKVLLLDTPLEVRELDSDAKINVNSLEEYEAFLDSEKKYIHSLYEKIDSLGVAMVVCQKGIDDELAYHLAKKGILAIRRTRKSDMEKLSLALQVPIVSSHQDILEEHLGFCNLIEQKEVSGENYIFLEGCKNPKSLSLFLRASSKHLLDELERAIEDALGDMKSLISSRAVLAGGGAIDTQLYLEMLEYSKQFKGKQRLILESLAKSFLVIPKTLCENSGLDEIESLSQIISAHEQKNYFCGIAQDKVVISTFELGIIEPILVKSQAISSSIETVSLLLRIDDIIAAKQLSSQ